MSILRKRLQNSLALSMLFFFVKSTLISFGGSNALFPIIRQKVIDEEWASQNRFDRALILANSIPGPTVVQVLSYVCIRRLGALKGTIICVLSFLPHILLATILLHFFQYLTNKYYIYTLTIGVLPVVVAILINFARRYMRVILKELVWYKAFSIMIPSFLYFFFVPVPYNIVIVPILLVVIATYIIIYLERRQKHRRTQSEEER